MSYPKARGLAAACGAVLLLLAPAASTSAGLPDCLFGPPADPSAPQPIVVSRTTYTPRFVAAPAYAPPACSTCVAPGCATCVPLTVQYVPQTSYRPLIPTVPLTAYVHQVRSVPYATYRTPLYDLNSSCASGVGIWRPATACYGCVSGACFGGSAGYTAVPGTLLPGGGSSCMAAPQVAPPATIPPQAMTVAPSGLPSGSIQAPAGSASVAPPKTYREGSGSQTQAQKPVQKPVEKPVQKPVQKPLQKPSPAAEGPALEGKPEPKLRPQPMRESALKPGPWIAPFGTPRQVGPDDRTTARPIRSAVLYPLTGWRPARD